MKKIYMILLLVLTGCGILNRSVKTSDKSFNSSSQTNLLNKAKMQRINDSQELVFKKDSGAANYSIHFWPKGALNFSADGKFMGEFDSILMVGKQNQQSASLALSQNHELDQNEFSTEVNNTKKIASGEESRQKTNSPDWKIVTVLTIILLLVVFMVGKRVVLALK